ncbi:amino acid ABC transporter ATP-binding protein [Cupriavidus sp. WS]|uniref:amino acid ABC transporter ATP-binding protein n=1 Tax=Cupriavidus sp. WS TaxID=1312922 RepID=UPI00048DF14D|nr:amino acid ABC transporter ATP-binding protein [Cupriavidus sp. WS]
MTSDADLPNLLMSARGVVKTFPGGKPVLHGIDFSVARGEVVSLIGPSGSGKTTLLRCLAMLETLTEGEVFVEGQRVACPKPGRDIARAARAVRADVGMVFQQFNLWPHLSVMENVIEALIRVRRMDRDAAVKKAEPLLDKVGLLGKRDDYPRRLSGGQQQRVAIARALAMTPKILLFDEPTSALDPELRQEVLLVMRELAREGMTMLVVTHEMGFASDVCSRVVFMDAGRIVEDAPPGQFFSAPATERARRFLSQLSS